MRFKTTDKKYFNTPIPPGEENSDFGKLIHDYVSTKRDESDKRILKTYTWMQEQTNGHLNKTQTIRAIEGWRMRMRREFLGWGIKGNPDCWEYIPIQLREWSERNHSFDLWWETSVLFQWRCHLWQARLRGCIESPIQPDQINSYQDQSGGGIHSPVESKVIWCPDEQFSFANLPDDVAEFLIFDWLARQENPTTPPIWNPAYDAHGHLESRYPFENWNVEENWIPETCEGVFKK